MQKAVVITISAAAILLAGATAQAGTWHGANVGAAVPNYTPIQPAACQGWGPFCPPGYVRTCGRWRCWCRPCV
jgi:hypothetical protein